MDALFILMYNLFLIVSYIKDEFKKVNVLTWKITKWDFNRNMVLISVSFEETVELFPVVVIVNGFENPVRWLTDKAYGELSFRNTSPVIRLSKEECEKRGVECVRIEKRTWERCGWIFLDIQDRKHKRALEAATMESKCMSRMHLDF